MATKYLISLMSFLAIFSYSSYAADTKVRIFGKVVTQTCNVIVKDKEKQVNFADFSQADFRQIGDVSASQAVKIGLEGCSQSIDRITYEFTGQEDSDNPDLLKVIGGNPNSGLTKVAEGLAVEILDSKNNPIKLGQTYVLTDVVFKDETNYDFNFFLRYKSTKQQITVGDASAVAYLDFNYE
ncbi:fimbrial protein [Orbus wheelerorum]|uniref:fimbrial protein n=1 Tax=Orbus wheelerorum TaxID=3074111 RepID=UPI00370D1B0E